MRKLFTALCISTSLVSAAAGPVLRFKQYHPRQHDGLVRTQSPKSMKATAPMKVSTEGLPELVANCILSSPGYGMYTLKAQDGASLTRVAETPAFEGGAVYVNGKYYACAYDYDDTQTLTMMKWYTYDALTWTLLSERDNPLDFSYIATDRTYDQSTGKVYSISYDKTGQAIWLSTTDIKTGAPTMIAALEKDVITIAANKTGALYGIDTKANLYKIDPRTAALTLIGNTGIFDDYQSDYTQSITFDTRTGKLYWAEFHTMGWFDAAAALYEVDTATGKAVKITDIPGAPELVGLYVNRYATKGVPDEVTGLRAVAKNEEATSFEFTFTAPRNAVEGTPLDPSTDIEVEVSVDGDLIDLLNVKPGATATTSAHTFANGLHTLRVTPSNSVGQGVMAGLSFYAGYDVPAAPQNVILTASGMTASLSWTAPSTGAQGGGIRLPLTYNVYRMPGDVPVASGISATTFSETLDEPALYSYKVTAVSPDGAGTPAESNALAIAVYTAPWQCGFDSQAQFDLFTIANFSESVKVWNYDNTNKCARHSWDLTYATDDWLISPAVTLDPAYGYEVSFDAWQMVESYPDHFELWYGTSPDPSAMTKLLDTGKLPTTAATFSAMAAPLGAGYHYFAIRGNNPRNGMMSYADNLKVTPKGSSGVPATVNNLSLKAADGGVNAVTVEFDAPDKMMNGQTLTGVTAIDIFRGASEDAVKTFASPAPGAHLTWTDNSVTQGTHSYRVVVRAPSGTSQPVSASVFVGIDVPGAVTGLKAEPTETGYFVTWEAPLAGVNGGNLNGLLTYRIERMVNAEPEVVEADWTGTSYSDVWECESQAFAYYRVTALTEAGESESSLSDGFNVGDAYGLPFEESFAGAATVTNPWATENVIGNQGSWQLMESGEYPYTKAHDNDGGVATFDGHHYWTKEMEVRLVTPRIDISKFVDPELTFHLYHFNGSEWYGDPEPVEEWMQVDISVDGKPYQEIPGGRFESYSETSGWQKHTLSLAPYTASREVRIAFRGHSAGCFNIHLDDLAVKGTVEQSGVEKNMGNMESVSAGKGEIEFRGLDSQLSVYDLAGNLLTVVNVTDGSVEIPAGVYIARTSHKAYKLMVK